MPRRTDPDAGRAALTTWATATETLPRRTLATAVRWSLELLADEFPGRAVEVRVPPHGAVQAVAGVRHTRGTPPAVVETDAATWLALASGDLDWATARRTARVDASGERSDLTELLPLPGVRRLVEQARAEEGA